MIDDSRQHWATIREKGSLLGMSLMLGIYRLGGDVLFRIVLVPVVLYYLLFNPVARRSSREYLRLMHRVKPDFPAPRLWHVFRHLWSFSITLLDKLAVWMGRITRADVEVHHSQIIDDLLARGQGAVLLISHLGNFEVCQALSETRPTLRLTVLQHTANAQKFNRLLARHAREARVDFIQVGEVDVGQAISLSERLAAGHFIAIGADRVPVANPGRSRVWPFLGRPAAFPSGPLVLAMALQAPVLCVQCIKLDGRYHISFEVLSEGGATPRPQRSARFDQLLAAYVANLERHCLQAPWQWYNFYPFWQADTMPGGDDVQQDSPYDSSP